MRLAGLLCLAAVAASAQTPTTVPQLEAPVGGPSGVSVQGLSIQGAAGPGLTPLAVPGLGLTPSAGLAPVPTIAPIAALTPVRAAPSVETKAAAPAAPVETLKPPAAVAPAIDLDAIEAAQGEEVIDKILRAYDSASHDYVGVGRSPAILVALMQNRDPGLARTLPLSDFYHHPEGRVRYYPPLADEVETRLFDHLDRYLPPSGLSGAKNLILMDFVKGGRSMIALDEYLKRYAARRHPAMSWEFFGLGLGEEHVGFVEAGRRYRVLTPAELSTPPILHTRMSFSWNKDLAEYDEFPAPFENAAALERRARYEAWRERLAKPKKP